MKTIRIAIADDQLLFRRGMVSLLGTFEGLEVVLQASDGNELLAGLAAMEQLPDIILLDLRMPGMDGLTAIEELKDQYPEIRIIVLSALKEERFVLHMMEHGASGYLVKDSEPEDVYTTICNVYHSGIYYNNLMIQAMHAHVMNPGKKVAVSKYGIVLTKREKEILQLICQEYTMPEIAERLFISHRTVEGHRNNLLTKTGVRNTAGLVRFAIQNKLFDVEE